MTVPSNNAMLHTENGASYLIRPMRAEDAPLLVELFTHMSAESRYRRFNQPLANPDLAVIERNARLMANVEADQGAAWLVFADTPEGEDRPVAGVRYMFHNPEDDSEAEVAITVRDDYQNQGIGRALLAYAADQARAAGIERFTGLVQAGNEPIWAIMRRLGVRVEHKYDGPFVQATVYLNEPVAQTAS